MKSTLINEADFAALYAAAQFAERVGAPLSTHVTLTWSLFGITEPGAVHAHLHAFVKCLRDWMKQRRLCQFWIFCNERGRIVGLHTHLAVYMPLDLRREFRAWVKAWAVRRYGAHIPRAHRVKFSSSDKPWVHWVIFSYIVKGYDPDVIVVSADHTANDEEIMLGDLIAYPWRDPGHVDIDRFKVSPHLKANITNELRRQTARRAPVDPFGQRKAGRLPVWQGFRSSYDEGCRDVRGLYPLSFRERVWPLAAILGSDPAYKNPLNSGLGRAK